MSAAPEGSRKPVVLLVDDKARNLQLLGNALLKNGYDVALADSGAEALEIIAESPPDLVLLDVMMPGMSGFDVCRRLKESEMAPNLEVIFVTAKTRKEDILEGFAAGGVDYITKPIQLPEVLARVKSQISLKFARDALRSANRDLSHVIQTQRRFLSILSHDVRAPLAGLNSLLADCIAGAGDLGKEDVVAMVRICADSCGRLVSFFEDALVWARTEADGCGEEERPFSLSDAVESVRSLLLPLFERKEVSLEISLPPGAAVFGWPNAVSTVLRNLLSNAVKFSPPGSRVRLSAAARADHFLVSVEDQGVGIPPERIATLFDPDSRRTTLGTGREKGAGVGLILCHSLVEKMGGSLEVASEGGKGSCFSFPVRRYFEEAGSAGNP
ncbi:MAG: response regulator [Puniceicoccaceae bacterium]